MRTLAGLEDEHIVDLLDALWDHEDPGSLKTTLNQEQNSSTWAFKLHLHCHIWYLRIDFTRQYTMCVQLYVVEYREPALPGRLIVKTVLPSNDPLWVDGEVTLFQRCAPILSNAHDQTNNVVACLTVIHRVRTHLRNKLDTPQYPWELNALRERQRL